MFVLSILLLLKLINVNANYMVHDHDGQNVVNKGLWIRKQDEKLEKGQLSNFVFDPNSLDIIPEVDDKFYAFGETDIQNTPFVTNYIVRNKRSPRANGNVRLRKNAKKCKSSPHCILNNIIGDKVLTESKLMTKLKPASVFNDYPYEVAILLDHTLDKENTTKKIVTIDKTTPKIDVKNKTVGEKLNKTNNNTQKHNIVNKESEIIKKIEIIEDYNVTDGSRKVDRHIFDKEDKTWTQNAPVPDLNTYKVVKEQKPLSERGLIKVLGMLTKTIKKVISHHQDIKKIHDKIHVLKVDVDNSVGLLFNKFKEFDVKYGYLSNISDEIKKIKQKVDNKSEYLKNKENEISQSLIEFENQQKKFLQQQQQFFSIQQLMLAQNEKINAKQNLIAKTQSEISHRQNNFARILKKAKQLYSESKLFSSKSKSKPSKWTTTTKPITTESVKIDLFSIPSVSVLVNQDKLILKEKDQRPVDDLVYKYYFNNTYIDNIMKSKILEGFTANHENVISRNIKEKAELPDKNKRSDDLAKVIPTPETKNTILFPVNNNINNIETKHRNKRWIRHHSRRRKHRKVETATRVNNHKTTMDRTTEKQADNILAEKSTAVNPDMTVNNNPFLLMATNFCNQIGRNENVQMLNWCVEKSLRKLQNIDMKIPAASLNSVDNTRNAEVKTSTTTKEKPTIVTKRSTKSIPQMTEVTTASPLSIPISTPTYTQITNNIMGFPDNDALESNLHQYELVTDKEGVFFYDAESLHASDIAQGSNSGVINDLIPDLNSNSRIEVDPETFDILAKRRAAVRRLNNKILKKAH